MTELARIKVTITEGGDWFAVDIHSLEMPGGAQWDALNGWRSGAEKVLTEAGNAGAMERRAAYLATYDQQLSQLEAVDGRVITE
jgi:hypothetical protein